MSESTKDRATSLALREMLKDHPEGARRGEVYEQFPKEPAAFAEQALAWVKDRSEMSGEEIDAVDWSKVHELCWMPEPEGLVEAIVELLEPVHGDGGVDRAPVSHLVAAVKEHAQANYDDGWDLIIESYTDAEIIEAIGAAQNVDEAITRMSEIVEVTWDVRRDREAFIAQQI